jgi:hypothetical protein
MLQNLVYDPSYLSQRGLRAEHDPKKGRKVEMESPQNSIWGPALWMILHSSAERIGTKVVYLPKEETRIWVGLLRSLQYSLPCPLCKKHYTAYSTSFPLLSITRETVRDWLFHLHQQVNQRTGKPDFIESVPEMYGQPFHFSKHYAIFAKHMSHAVRLGWCAREDVQRTARFIEEMKRFYDFF